MANYKPSEPLVTGIGVTSSIGQGKAEFISSLLDGRQAFGIMKRPGRQKDTAFIGAEIPKLNIHEDLSKRLIRSASFSGQAALTTLKEAWDEAKLDQVDPSRIGLVIGGSNIQQREMVLACERYASTERLAFIRPTYALSFMDSDLAGLCTEQFGIKGAACTVGGASASGQMAIIQALQTVRSGQVDVCLAVGALMDISYMECQAFRSLGAMGSERYADDPALACRPFDQNRDGFIYGESCGVIVVERADHAIKRSVKPYAAIAGWSVVMDGNRNPDPSYEGEVQVIRQALKHAEMAPAEIEYINPHGTGSLIGDETEIKAIRNCGLGNAWLNATKSIIGHGISAAGAVEVIATLLQMRASCLHPTLNLNNPIDASMNWVLSEKVSANIRHALTLGMGFGGINTALCFRNAV
ncbi:beta-ketoacyl synthase N-terminal-like domain-containing protein [Bacillus paralicheniformis]|uniref:beta-ketoacyl synthase N-terminal-like domain-containing protein n=1 Tax=Bacillus paralicheniformis TaxID=1648923 RepID=UPI000D0325DC|nr:beta-ketoacyl synthase N-terminal-like domain-containing protein [Bacillus paralicheniformis]